MKKIKNIICIALLLILALPTSSATTISPWGDSITAAPDSYRYSLWNQLHTSNYNFDFVGSFKGSSSDACPDKNHEGHSGMDIGYFLNNANYFLTVSPNPNIMLLHIGTNERGRDIFVTAGKLSQLIDKIVLKSPNTKIYVSSLIGIKDSSLTAYNETAWGISYNKLIPIVVTQKQSEGKKVYFVDMYNEANLDFALDYRDGLHPNFAGSNKIAMVWFNHIKEDMGVIPITPTPTPTVTATVTPTPTPTPTGTINIIKNPGFDTLSPWSFYINSLGNVNTNDHNAKVTISLQGSNIQLYQKGIALKPYKNYRLTFDAYSNTGHDISISLFKHVSPFTNYGLSSNFNLETNWQAYSYDFTTKNFINPVYDARLMFWFSSFAKSGDVYYIDNVILQEV